MLYVLYHENYNEVETEPDFFHKYYSTKPQLKISTSPITIFVRTRTGMLQVVAIQLDYKPSKFSSCLLVTSHFFVYFIY